MLAMVTGGGEDLEVAWKYKVLRAAERGAACKVDLSDHWDAFAVADAPVEQLRAEYGIPAR
jgi:hypothetical protein